MDAPDPCPKSSNVEAYVEAKRAQIAAPPGLPHLSEEDYRVRRPAASTAHPGAAIPSTFRRTGSNAIALAKPPPFALQLTPCERETERPTWALALPAESNAPVRGRRPQPAWVTCETLPPEEGKQVIHNVAQPESQAQPMAVQEAVAEQVTTNTLIHELSSDSSSDSADTRAAVNRVRASLRRSRQIEAEACPPRDDRMRQRRRLVPPRV